MPVPNSMADLATLASSNSPPGTEVIGNSLDNYIRALSAILRSTNGLASSIIAAGSTTDLATADAECVQVSGSTTISSFGTGFNGCRREVRFSGSCTISHTASIVCPGAQNLVVAAGDVVSARCVASNTWIIVGVSRAQAALGYTPVNKAGDTGIGALSSVSYASTTGVFGCAAAGTLRLQPNGVGVTTGELTITTAGLATVNGQLVATSTVTGRGGINVENGTAAQAWQLRAASNVNGDYLTFDHGSGGFFNNVIMYAGGRTDFIGPLIVGSGNLGLKKLTISNSAPGALTEGEVYFQY